jgi:phospholipase C
VFSGEGSGTSIDDHPHADIRAGEAFLHRIYTAVTQSPAWSSTVLVITYDEWGGFFDHVPPSPAPIPESDRAAGNTDGLRGFRLPTLLISPFSRRTHVSHALFDHTSILRMIEARWGLEPLSIRTRSVNSLAHALDLQHPQLAAPQYPAPFVPPAHACSTAALESRQRKWAPLASLVRGVTSAA